MARARQRSCFWPWDRLAPEEEMGEVRERKMFWFSLGAVVGSIAVEAGEDPASPSEEGGVAANSGTGVLSAEGMR